MEFKLKDYFEVIKRFFNNLGKVAIIVIAMACGYAASEIYHRYEDGVKAHKMQKTRSANEVKVFINGNEMAIMDIKTGTYHLYDKSVVDIIFGLRANYLYNSSQKSK